MRLCVTAMSALRVVRAIRHARATLPHQRCCLPTPDPSPQQRWTTRLLPLDRLALTEPPSHERPLDVAVPSAETRIQASFVRCSVHSAKGGIPDGSYLNLGDGLFIPCPELLFLELAAVMPLEVHALVGYELCGSYTRDPVDPRCADVTHNVPPVTSVVRVRRFLESCGSVRLKTQTLEALGLVRDNAWSAMESVLALETTAAPWELGYDLGDVSLNVRHENAPELTSLGCARSRVPDIEIVGSSVGFNYDGRGHLDLEAIASAEAGPEAAAQICAVREKYLDDLRRNRELTAQGRVVLPVTAEDLFAEGGLDAVMLEAAMAMERWDGRDPERRAFMRSQPLRRARQQQIWSLLPWRRAAAYAR